MKSNTCPHCGGDLSVLGSQQNPAQAESQSPQAAENTIKATRALSTAVSHLRDVESRIETLADVHKKKSGRAGFVSSFSGFAPAVVLPYVLSQVFGMLRRTEELFDELGIADDLIDEAETADDSIVISVADSPRESEMTVLTTRAWRWRIAADIHLASDEKRLAGPALEQAIVATSRPDDCFRLAEVHMDRKKPDKALEMFQRVCSLDPDSELGIEARKEAGRITAKRIFGDKYWFVGSGWLVAILLFLTVISIIGTLGNPTIPNAVMASVFSLILALYIWRRVRRYRPDERAFPESI